MGRIKVFWTTTLLGLIGLFITLILNVWIFVLGLTLSCVAVFTGQSCALGFIRQ
ncbi:hypothetical protein OENI_120005 [Oenococcus oeni]|nr:hypothetical protein OENI_120005 [Oenococcus oeni]